MCIRDRSRALREQQHGHRHGEQGLSGLVMPDQHPGQHARAPEAGGKRQQQRLSLIHI